MIALLSSGAVTLPPATIKVIASEMPSSLAGRADGIAEVRWGEQNQRFLMECKRSGTPLAFENALMQVQSYARDAGIPPLLFLPYLSEAQLTRLEGEKVSGIDLCGNGVILATNLRVWRSGHPNTFRFSQPIKNIFRGASSLIARCFLLRPRFVSLIELTEYAGLRQMEDANIFVSRNSLTKATASKVVSALVDDLIVKRDRAELYLADADRLMDRLRANHAPITGRTITGKTPFGVEKIWDTLLSMRGSSLSFRYTATGAASAERYRVLSNSGPLSLYVGDYDAALNALQVRQSRIFPNIELIETVSDIAYFDARTEEQSVWASPVQTWLELAHGGPREQDAAGSLATLLAKSEGEIVK